MTARHQKLSASDVDHARKVLAGLLWECPLGWYPKHCPFYGKRHGSLDERLMWLRKLSDEECLKMYEHHLECMAGKVGDPP